MIIFRYDKTFEGLLTTVFDAYARKAFPTKLLNENEVEPLFAEEIFHVFTDSAKATTSLDRLEEKNIKERLQYAHLCMAFRDAIKRRIDIPLYL